MAISSDLEHLLVRWLPRQRWMPGLGAPVGAEPDITPQSVVRIAQIDDPREGTIQCLLVVLAVRGPARSARLCVPLTVRTIEDYSLRPHLVGTVDDLLLGRTFVYDGAADPVCVVALAQAIDGSHPLDEAGEWLEVLAAGDELRALTDLQDPLVETGTRIGAEEGDRAGGRTGAEDGTCASAAESGHADRMTANGFAGAVGGFDPGDPGSDGTDPGGTDAGGGAEAGTAAHTGSDADSGADDDSDAGAALLQRAALATVRGDEGLGVETRLEVDGPDGVTVLTLLREIGAENPPALRFPLALTARDSVAIHPVIGWAETQWFDDVDRQTITAPFAMLAHALPESRRAWRSAVEKALVVDSGSVGSFNRQGSALGAAAGRLHVDLAAEFGTVRSEGAPTQQLVEKWRDRIDWALRSAPAALAPFDERLRAHQEELGALDSIGLLQRIHGELTLDHITVGTAEGPRIIGFGVGHDEPRPVEIDLVALVRSIDYAAGYAWLQRTGESADGETALRRLATQGLDDATREDYLDAPEHLWFRRTANSLLSGYSHARAQTSALTDPLLRAALIDRLLVETVTELRNRPAWLIVPLAALAEMLGGTGPTSDEAAALADPGDDESDGAPDDSSLRVDADQAESTAGDASLAAGADIMPDRSRYDDDRVPRAVSGSDAYGAAAAAKVTAEVNGDDGAGDRAGREGDGGSVGAGDDNAETVVEDSPEAEAEAEDSPEASAEKVVAPDSAVAAGAGAADPVLTGADADADVEHMGGSDAESGDPVLRGAEIRAADSDASGDTEIEAPEAEAAPAGVENEAAEAPVSEVPAAVEPVPGPAEHQIPPRPSDADLPVLTDEIELTDEPELDEDGAGTDEADTDAVPRSARDRR